MSKERRLGRGLEALLGRPLEGSGAPADGQHHATTFEPRAGTDTGDSLVRLNVYEIDRNPFQPRRDFDEETIQSLAASIKDHGMLQPIIVRRTGTRFELIAGERRLRAATAAGLDQVPAQIRDVDDRQVAELALVENIQRKDLNALEKAASFQQYLEQYQCTQEDLAKRVKIDRSTIANLIRLLELPEVVQQAVRTGAISQGHARALLPLGDEREQIDFCQKIQRESLSVRVTEEQVQEQIRSADADPISLIDQDGRPTKAPRTRSEHLASLEQELRSALGTKVDLRQTSRGRGRIVIHFKSNQEFERLRTHLAGQSNQGPHFQVG